MNRPYASPGVWESNEVRAPSRQECDATVPKLRARVDCRSFWWTFRSAERPLETGTWEGFLSDVARAVTTREIACVIGFYGAARMKVYTVTSTFSRTVRLPVFITALPIRNGGFCPITVTVQQTEADEWWESANRLLDLGVKS